MNHFDYHDGELHCEEVPLAQIAREVGTPAYVYSAATLTRHFTVFENPLSVVPHMICYSVKACSNIAVLRLLGNLGAGFDIVSAGELHRLREAGLRTDRVVFSGVGKTAAEMRAGLAANIHAFNVESVPELHLLSQVATAEGVAAPVSLRVNPDVDPETHPYIATGLRESKFGIAWSRALDTYDLAGGLPGIEVVGLDCHIGSQLTSLDPFMEALDRMLELVDALRERGHSIRSLDLGGGLGISYRGESPPHPRELARAVIERTAGYDLTLVFEPGRVIVGNAGVLLMKVLYDKRSEARRFAIVDAAMNDSIRPALYQAYHDIRPVTQRPEGTPVAAMDVVGPICESGDFFARDRPLPDLEAGQLIALMSAGAYGFTMSSNYNSRPRVAEVLVNGSEYAVVRQRETLADLVRGESIPDFLKAT